MIARTHEDFAIGNSGRRIHAYWVAPYQFSRALTKSTEASRYTCENLPISNRGTRVQVACNAPQLFPCGFVECVDSIFATYKDRAIGNRWRWLCPCSDIVAPNHLSRGSIQSADPVIIYAMNATAYEHLAISNSRRERSTCNTTSPYHWSGISIQCIQIATVWGYIYYPVCNRRRGTPITSTSVIAPHQFSSSSVQCYNLGIPQVNKDLTIRDNGRRIYTIPGGVAPYQFTCGLIQGIDNAQWSATYANKDLTICDGWGWMPSCAPVFSKHIFPYQLSCADIYRIQIAVIRTYKGYVIDDGWRWGYTTLSFIGP